MKRKRSAHGPAVRPEHLHQQNRLAVSPQPGGVNVREWLGEILPKHQRLLNVAEALLKNLLADYSANILEIRGRVKDIDRTIEKIARKSYTDPKRQLTDLCGLRVIVYFEHQIQPILRLLEKVFDVVETDNSDSSLRLGSDRVGYRSVHLVCKLGDRRANLSEYLGITDLVFEIQLRTVLQHAWAELAHDRSYKFSAKLRDDLQRRVNLCSAMLEMMDREFVSIVHDIDEYAGQLASDPLTLLLAREIDSQTLTRFLDIVFEQNGFRMRHLRDPVEENQVIREMDAFGLKTISDISAAISPQFIQSYRHSPLFQTDTTIGFLRSVMMYVDLDRYFEIWSRSWSGIDQETIDFLAARWGKQKLNSLIEAHNLDVIDRDEDSDDLVLEEHNEDAE